MKTDYRKKRPQREVNAETRILSEPLRAEFLRFMEYHQAGRISRNLRNLLLEFLMYDGGTEAIYLKELLYDLRGLYELLDAIESEVRGAEKMKDRKIYSL